ncbi:hypothetical protein DCAR_0832872 [Daucus carota subsp. sativus]|uniref:Uncharacterized protein n=1 Tax=Daucus carota subsp. sativus TaxID=79200 RepID=A0A175YQ53_DAUCS|nr:hypothetical protein DCAR_0832872 [Daucus carota subsp. sativus]
MSFCGQKRSCSFIYSSSLILFLVVTFLHIRPHAQVEASRMLQALKEPYDHVKIQGMTKISIEANHFREFFKGRGAPDVDKDKGFEDNKRRVPSCPDALHNK